MAKFIRRKVGDVLQKEDIQFSSRKLKQLVARKMAGTNHFEADPVVASVFQKIHVYPWNRACLEAGSPVRVVYESNPEWRSLGIKSIFDRIDFAAWANRLYRLPGVSERGNFQFGYGFNGGANTVCKEDNVLFDFGSTFPQINVGTNDNVADVVSLSEIARAMNMLVSMDSFYDDPFVKERWDRCAKSLNPRNLFEAWTVALLVLDGANHVRRHQDTLNDATNGETIVVSTIVKLHDGNLAR